MLSFLLLVVTCGTVGLLIVFWRRWTPPPAIPNVPIVPSNSIFGFRDFRSTKQGNGHRVVCDLVERLGPLMQFVFLGLRVVVICDEVLARSALRDVKGKGFIHNPAGGTPQTLNMDTNAEWQARRNNFRKAFSTSALQAHISTVKNLCLKMYEYLDKSAISKNPIQIDTLFSQLTIDVISEVAFDQPIDALGKSKLYDKMHYATTQTLEVCTC